MDDGGITILSHLKQRLACDCECLAEPVDACQPGVFSLRGVGVQYERDHPLDFVCLLHVEVVVTDLGLFRRDTLLEDLDEVSLLFLSDLPHRTGVPLDDLFVIHHHKYLMILDINTILELDFGQHLSQGLLLIVSLAKVLADKTSDLKVRQSCPPQGYLRLVEDLQRRIAPDYHVECIHSRFCHRLLNVDGVAHGDSLCKEPLSLIRADESVL